MTTERRWWPDAIAVAVVLAVFVFVVAHARGRSFDPIIDAGRDLYISQQIRSGGTLYRDIVYVFPPLAPYALALITGITGSTLAAFEWIGIAIALATAGAVYALARNAGGAPAAGAAALMFAAASVYSVSDRTSNYLLPYAWSGTIGMLLLVAGVALLMRQGRWPVVAGLVALVAASWTKIELAAFSIALIAVIAFIRRLSMRALAGHAAAAVASLAAIVWYFAADLPSLFSPEFVKPFYRSVTGLDAPAANALASVIGLLYLAAMAGAIALASRFGRIAMIVAAATLLFIGWYAGLDFFRGWLLLQLLVLPFAIRRPREPLLILLVLSLCTSSRLLLHMTPQWYGFLFLVPVYATVAYVLMEWLPERGWYSRQAALLWLIPIAIVSTEMIFVETMVMSQKRFAVTTKRGVFFDSNADRAAVLNDFLAEAGARRMRSLVMITEGLGINYLAGVPTTLRFHSFHPLESASPEIEQRIIADLESSPPEYIAVVSRVLMELGSRGFGIDYDQRLAAAIRARYRVERVWHRPNFELILLRKR